MKSLCLKSITLNRLSGLGWLLVPFLLVLSGWYLEGSPYRLIVRSPLFMFCVAGISVFACIFIRRVRSYPAGVCAVYAAVVCGGFIYSARQYYDGAGNDAYFPALILWGSFMGLNALLYVLGLFAPFFRKISQSNHPDMASDRQPNNENPRHVDSYDIQLFRLNQDKTKGAVCFHMRGSRPLFGGFFINGFSQDQFVDLSLYWPTISEQRLEFFSTSISTYETIVKFGDTLQMTDTYQLEINTVFSDPA